MREGDKGRERECYGAATVALANVLLAKERSVHHGPDGLLLDLSETTTTDVCLVNRVPSRHVEASLPVVCCRLPMRSGRANTTPNGILCLDVGSARRVAEQTTSIHGSGLVIVWGGEQQTALTTSRQGGR